MSRSRGESNEAANNHNGFAQERLTNRWSGRVRNRVPSSYDGVGAAQLNSYASG
jgi:hypothetical protein